METGKMELHLERFSLRKASEEACAVTKPIAQNKGILLEVHVVPKIADVTLNQQKFKQVLYNLLFNAVKFTDDGGKVEIRAVLNDAHRFKLVVKGTGVAIKPEDLQKLFKKFEQLESKSWSCKEARSP